MLKSIKKSLGLNPMHKYKEILSTHRDHAKIINEILEEYNTKEELEKAIQYLEKIKIQSNEDVILNRNIQTIINILNEKINDLNNLNSKKSKIIQQNEAMINRAFNESLRTDKQKLIHFSLKKGEPNIPPPQSIVNQKQLSEYKRPKTNQEKRGILSSFRKGGKKKRKTRKKKALYK
jgi:membrane glycosyltransferase